MDLAPARARLFENLQREIQSPRVISAMMAVPRDFFVPSHVRHLAYEDIPLPLTQGQTISQPYIVAVMTQALELSGDEKVLEVGTGSGYQAAILAELAREVVTVERFADLAEEARRRLDSLGYHNVVFHVAGKELGWPQDAPYDAIIVTAAAPKLPPSLFVQLKEDGRMVIPVGSRHDQDLLLLVKRDGKAVTTNLGGCRFVPLIGEEAWEESELDDHFR